MSRTSAAARAKSVADRRKELAALLEDADRRLAELRHLRESLHDDDEHDPDGVSLSSEWSRLEGLRQSRLEALAEIDDAAARLERGEYGICSVCGKPIAAARLDARPGATECIDHAR